MREAREFVRSALVGCSGAVTDVAALLTGELVTNAVLHSPGTVELTVSVDEASVRVDVADGSDAVPVVRPQSVEREDGRGMAIVEALARAWGVERRRSGKSVWFELGA